MAADVIRTPEELRNPEFNYFIAFKIDLKESDQAKIEPKIKTAMSATGGSIYSRRLLELKKDIEEIMYHDAVYDAASGSYRRNAGGRAKEAADAKAFKLQEATALVEQLSKTRKTLLRSDLKEICNKANEPVKYFEEAELDARIEYLVKQKTIEIIENEDSKIPFSDYQKIEQLLQTLLKKDLYEFLELGHSASLAEIQAAIKATYQNQKTSNIKIKQAISKLCAQAEKIAFASAETRKNYDYYLALRVDIWEDFEKRKTFGIKELTMEEFCRYAQIAVDLLKIDAKEAEKLIAIGCNHFRFVLVGNGAGNDLEHCPYPACNKLFVKGAKNCPHCGKPLEVICWNCQQKVAFTKDDRGCATCGATQHAHDEFTKRCGQIEALLGNPDADIAALKQAILGLKNIVPNYAAVAASTLAKKVASFESVIDARIKQEETVGNKYREEIVKIRESAAKKNFQSALSLAKALPTKFSNYQPEATKRIIAEMSAFVMRATQQVELAKRAIVQRNEKMAIDSAMKALEICADYAEARQILQKFPPKAPVGVTAKLAGNGVYLEWNDNSGQEHVTYTVIKKIGVAPVSVDDGAVAAEGLSIKFYEDNSIVPASPYYYAVYAERFGIKSAIVATQSPVVIYSDVSSVRQEVVYEGIKALWDMPQNVTGVEVWKNKGPVAPLRPGEGVRVEADSKGFFDAKADGESAYLIICNYKTANGVVRSKGVRVVFKPFAKIAPLSGTKFLPLGNNRFAFSCAAGYSGKVCLYVSPKKLNIPLGQTLNYIDFNTICKGLTPVESQQNGADTFEFSLAAGRMHYVYPIVQTEQLFVVAEPALFNCIDGFTYHAHKVVNGTLTVEGDLHAAATAVVVALSPDGYVDTLDKAKEKYVFKKADFAKAGKFEIQLKVNTVNYISVFAEFNTDGIVTHSGAVKAVPVIDHRQAVTVHFKLDYTVSPMKPFKLTAIFEADEPMTLANLLVKQGYPRPRLANEGQRTEILPEIVLKKKMFSQKYTARYTITVPPTAKNTGFALFAGEGNAHVKLREVQTLK
ncbi:MAG: zinc ribbon domain-containing protein [Clostridia bacterium]|nr:zinc ribbon domain-containing protein [Clostridia bacterium]